MHTSPLRLVARALSYALTVVSLSSLAGCAAAPHRAARTVNLVDRTRPRNAHATASSAGATHA